MGSKLPMWPLWEQEIFFTLDFAIPKVRDWYLSKGLILPHYEITITEEEHPYIKNAYAVVNLELRLGELLNVSTTKYIYEKIYGIEFELQDLKDLFKEALKVYQHEKPLEMKENEIKFFGPYIERHSSLPFEKSVNITGQLLAHEFWHLLQQLSDLYIFTLEPTAYYVAELYAIENGFEDILNIPEVVSQTLPDKTGYEIVKSKAPTFLQLQDDEFLKKLDLEIVESLNLEKVLSDEVIGNQLLQVYRIHFPEIIEILRERELTKEDLMRIFSQKSSSIAKFYTKYPQCIGVAVKYINPLRNKLNES